jgi:hypothetical protein
MEECVHKGNEAPSRTRFVYGVSVLICAVVLAGGWKNFSNAATAGPKGQFGVDGAETLKYLRGLDFTIASTGDSNVVKQYQCGVNPNSCPSEGIRLMLVPEAAAEQRDWESAMQPGRAGHVVAIVVNVDGKPFPDLNLKPGERAYAWVGQIGQNATERGFAIYKLDANGLATNTWFKTTDVSHCDNDDIRNKPAIKTAHPAGGKPCARIKVGSASIASLASHTSRDLTGAMVGGSLWISCSGGCCQVNAPN